MTLAALCLVLAAVGVVVAAGAEPDHFGRFRRQSSYASASASASSSTGGGGVGNNQGYAPQPPYQRYGHGYGQGDYGQGYYPDPAQIFQDFARNGGFNGAGAAAGAGNQFPNYYQGFGFHNYGPNFDYFRYNQPGFNFPDFNRLANDINARTSGAGGGGTSFHSSTSSNVNGVQSSSGVHVDPVGRVTTYRDGVPVSGGSIQGRSGGGGGANGVYSVSSTSVDQNGRVSSYKDAGHF